MNFELNAKPRTELGRSECRRARRLLKRVPGVIYGGGIPPETVSFALSDLMRVMHHEAFFSHIVDITQENKGKQHTVLKEIQRHPVSMNNILHIDFMRVDVDKPINVKIPLHFINDSQCKGVKVSGGIISHLRTEIEVFCKPSDVPDFITVDMLLVDIGQTIAVEELELPKGIELSSLYDSQNQSVLVAIVKTPRGTIEEEEEGVEEQEDKQE